MLTSVIAVQIVAEAAAAAASREANELQRQLFERQKACAWVPKLNLTKRNNCRNCGAPYEPRCSYCGTKGDL